MTTKSALDDNTWFDLQFDREAARRDYGIPLPGLPPDDVQRRFTGQTGRENLAQAFDFYKYVRSTCKLREMNDPKILDFGGGWGRISRFFFRDTKPENIWVSDCLTDSIRWLKETGNPCQIVKNEPLPPIVGLEPGFDLIYAFSVFSHLSQEFLDTWIPYLMSVLRPGGYLIVTTRGREFIKFLELLHRQKSTSYLVKYLPEPSVIRERWVNGEVQFYPCGGGGELTGDFYGEALIPKKYFEERHGTTLVSFLDEVRGIDQSVVLLRRPC